MRDTQSGALLRVPGDKIADFTQYLHWPGIAPRTASVQKLAQHSVQGGNQAMNIWPD